MYAGDAEELLGRDHEVRYRLILMELHCPLVCCLVLGLQQIGVFLCHFFISFHGYIVI
jgi:hypothetical protein